MNKIYKLPEGFRDYLPDECYAKTQVTERIQSVFYKNGYEKVETPSVEYADLFNSGAGAVDMSSMFKMSDTDGELTVLRPDITLPVSRIVASKLKSKIEKLYYTGNSYQFVPGTGQREFTQAGIEFYGEKSYYADAEVISIAIEALLASGLKHFIIDIGQVEYFLGLIKEYGISAENGEKLRRFINKKNGIGVELLLSEIKKENADKLKKLPGLYGGIEILDIANRNCSNEISRNALINLRNVYVLLESRGYADYISIDLGMLGSLGYYTGIVFKGITKYFGASILSGGRYDTLMNTFGSNLCATGFAVGIDNLTVALEKSGVKFVRPGADICLGAVNSSEEDVVKLMKRYYNKRIDRCYCGTESEITEYAKNKGIKKIVIINGKDAGEIDL